MKKLQTWKEIYDSFKDIKEDHEYTDEDIKALEKEEAEYLERRKKREKHAKLQTFLDVCAAEYNRKNQH